MIRVLIVAGMLMSVPAFAQSDGSTPAIRFLPAEEALFRDLVAPEPTRAEVLRDPVIGAVVPLPVDLQRFPGEVMAMVPATRGLRYVKTADGIVVVDPDTRRIVQVLRPARQP